MSVYLSFRILTSRFLAIAQERDELEAVAGEERTREQTARLATVTELLNVERVKSLAFFDELERAFSNASGAEAIAFGKMNLESLEGMQSVLRDLGGNAAIVNYVITSDKVRILLATPHVQLFRDSAVPQTRLLAELKAYRAILQNPAQDPIANASALYDILIRPIEEPLAQAKVDTLVFGLHGALRYIPMAALYDGEHWLVERYALSVYTAGSRNLLAIKPKDDWRVAAFAASQGANINGHEFQPYVIT